MTSPTSRRLAAAVVTVVLAAGCTPDAPTPAPSPPPAAERWSDPRVADYRMVWTAEPGIDLLAGPAVPLRAYVESMELAQTTGTIDGVYPGFTRAVLPDVPDSKLLSELGRWPNVDISAKKPLVGNRLTHVLAIGRSGRDVTAVVCTYGYRTAEPDDGGTFVVAGQSGLKRGPNGGISASLVKMQAPEANSSPPPPQKGPAPAPFDDVFGAWKITGVLDSFSSFEGEVNPEWPTQQADLAACVQKAPDSPQQRQFLIDGRHPRSDFPTRPATPGWPLRVS